MNANPLILIVNDELNLRGDLKNALPDDRWRVREAGDGREALRMARKYHPALILLDLIMPGPDGFTTLAALKLDSRLASIPVVFYSTRRGEVFSRIARDLGAADYIAAPAGPEEISSRVEKALAAGGGGR